MKKLLIAVMILISLSSCATIKNLDPVDTVLDVASDWYLWNVIIK